MKKISMEFWEELGEKNPKLWEEFLTWIDKWKKENQVDKWGIESYIETIEIKFHHYPPAMQLGIMMEFFGYISLQYKVRINMMVTGEFFFSMDPDIAVMAVIENVFDRFTHLDKSDKLRAEIIIRPNF